MAYEVAFGRAGAAVGEADIVPWTVVGLNTSVVFTVALQDGERYAAHVRAFNGIGGRSSTFTSNGIVVDLSPPTALPPCVTQTNSKANLIQDSAFAHDPENVFVSAFAGTACTAGVEEEDGRPTMLRLRHMASLVTLPPVMAAAPGAQLVCSTVHVDEDSSALSNTTDAAPHNHTFACSAAPALPEDGGRPPVALRCRFSHVANGSATVTCAWDGNVDAATAEMVETGAVLDSANGTLQCAFTNATTGVFICVELGGDREAAPVSVVGLECKVEHADYSTIPDTTTAMPNTTAMLNTTAMHNTTAMPLNATVMPLNATAMPNNTTAVPNNTTAMPITTTKATASTMLPHPSYDRITCSLQRRVTAAPQGVAVLLHPLSASVTDDLGYTPPSETSFLLGAHVSCATTSARLQGKIRARIYRMGAAAAETAALAISQVAECPVAEPAQVASTVRLDWSIEGAAPMLRVAECEVLEMQLEVLQGAVAIGALAPDSGGAGCDAVSEDDTRAWLLSNGTWVTGASSGYGNVSRRLKRC